jgi:hypothetical protein
MGSQRRNVTLQEIEDGKQWIREVSKKYAEDGTELTRNYFFPKDVSYGGCQECGDGQYFLERGRYSELFQCSSPSGTSRIGTTLCLGIWSVSAYRS